MKKLFALALALMMLCSVSFAEVVGSTMYYDPAVVENLGLGGGFVGLEQFGLMFYCPEALVQVPLTPEETPEGVLAYFATEDDSCRMSIGYGPAVDGEGNAVTDLNALAAFYASAGMDEAVVIAANDLPCVSYISSAADTFGLVFLLSNGNQLTFNFSPFSDPVFCTIATVMMTSIMPMQTAE